MTILVDGSVDYEVGNQAQAAACRELDDVIGPHTVTTLTFCDDTWNTPGVCGIFEAAPSLKYAEDVVLHSPNDESTVGVNSAALMGNFAAMKALCLYLGYRVFRHFSWTFLRQASARELRLIRYIGPIHPPEDFNRCVEELVRHCSTDLLELDFSAVIFSAAFCRRIVELLKSTGRGLTFRMTLQNGALILNEGDYTVDADDTATRYASVESGIVVEVVNGRWITIKSSAQNMCKGVARDSL